MSRCDRGVLIWAYEYIRDLRVTIDPLSQNLLGPDVERFQEESVKYQASYQAALDARQLLAELQQLRSDINGGDEQSETALETSLEIDHFPGDMQRPGTSIGSARPGTRNGALRPSIRSSYPGEQKRNETPSGLGSGFPIFKEPTHRPSTSQGIHIGEPGHSRD